MSTPDIEVGNDPYEFIMRQADRIEALEKALREILRAPIHMAKDIARTALEEA